MRIPSYSPFPADLGIDPVHQFSSFASEPGPFSEVAIETLEPLAHLRHDFEIDNVRLSDFESQPSSMSVRGGNNRPRGIR